VFDNGSFGGRTVLVQGVGNVGERLARLVSEAGARVLVNDIDADRAEQLAGELGGEAVTEESLYKVECDVYAPCAIGATLNRETIPGLGCKIVCGSANNQLAEEGDSELLRERGIVYAPDYIVNAGGALSFALIEDGIIDRDDLLERMSTVGRTVHEILTEAIHEDESPVATARRKVARKLAPGG
jgi:leucine dehydrogenase